MNENSMNNDVTMRPNAGASLGRIDQYELIRELGGGGFGCVYLARDTDAGIEVAVKGLPPLIRLNKEELENVRQNFALVSRLYHPNIAAALHFQKVQTAVYNNDDVKEKLRVFKDDPLVVMQYARGVTLSQWRKQFPDGKVPLDKALEITRQIASALDYAHEEKILHRDIKPANVMIETGGDGKITARVLDFGLAAEIRSSMSRVSQSITDTSGTRPYMAPEQWLGREQGKETDLYALAVLFNELVTGKVPFASVFDTGDPVLMMNVVGREEPEVSSDLPKTIRLALTKALAKKREDRFELCLEFVEALMGVMPRSKTFGRTDVPASRARGLRSAAIISAVAALGLAIGGVWYWQSDKAKEEARIVAEQKAEEDRKAAEEARRIAAEKAKAEKAEAERNQREEAEREAEARVSDIMVEATVKKNQVLRIDDGDGFDRRKTILSDMLTKATAYGNAKQWDKAALNFTNYVECCNKLITLDGERKIAKEIQSTALVSQRKAANAESSKYASVRWGAASDVMKKANEHFSQMEFSEAKGFYESATSQFELCVGEAKIERERQVLEALAANPGKVLKKDLFTPKLKKYEWICTEISRVQGELSALLVHFTEEDSDVQSKRKELNELLEKFVTQIEKDGLGDKARKALGGKNLANAKDVIEKPLSDESLYFTYEVRSGDSLMGVLKKYRVKLSAWRDIAKINKLTSGRISLGQKLMIPKSLLGSADREEKVYEGEASLKHGDRKTLTLPGGEKMTMIYVAPGSFMMGSSSSEDGRGDYEPEHHVTLTKGYWLGETEVTQAQWESVMGSNPSYFKGASRPVEQVSWEDCQKFISKIKNETRRQFGGEARLPTEAEWEYACRAGTNTALSNGKLTILGEYNGPELDEVAWYGGNSSVGFELSNGYDCSGWAEKQYEGTKAGTHPVAKKAKNPWGFYDMHGNVCEWCQDWYGAYPSGAVTDPLGSAWGGSRVLRGGSWGSVVWCCRSACRNEAWPGDRGSTCGFRLACSVELQKKMDSAAREDARPPISQSVSKVQLWEGGPYWATKNIGAEKPEDYGYYFWWGDTVGYKREGDKWVASDGSASNFAFGDSNTPTYGKSVSDLRSEGWITADGVLSPQHDAAQKHWGGAWRMPTYKEFEDLGSKCDWSWAQVNGVNGYLVSGKGEYSSKSIFLPCAGYVDGTLLYGAGSHGYYWWSVPSSDGYDAWGLRFFSGNHGTYYYSRYSGQPVRPLQGFTK